MRILKRVLFAAFGLLVLILPNSIFSQTISGKVTNFDTSEPLSCMVIKVTSVTSSYYTETHSLPDGTFAFDDELDLGYYIVSINHYNYHDYDTTIRIEDEDVVANIKLISYDSESFIEETKSSNFLTQWAYTLDFIIPNTNDNDKLFKSYFATEFYTFNFTFRNDKHIQFGLKYSALKLGWANISNDTSITTEAHTKERYFEMSTSLSAYTRIKFNGIGTEEGAFLDLGIGYSLPYLFKYTYYIDDKTKTTTRGFHQFNDVRTFARLGYSWFAFKAEYLLTNTLKAPYFQEPRFRLGVEFLIPITDN